MSHLLTSEEVAERLGVGGSTVRRWRHEKTGPPPVYLSARTVRYRLEDLEAWIADSLKRTVTCNRCLHESTVFGAKTTEHTCPWCGHHSEIEEVSI